MAGYAAILKLPSLKPAKLRAHIEHLASLMYLATQLPWSIIRDLHAAVLYEIECGRASWGDSFTYLESRILHSPVKQFRAAGARNDTSPAIFFCRSYQNSVCKATEDHYGTIRG